MAKKATPKTEDDPQQARIKELNNELHDLKKRINAAPDQRSAGKLIEQLDAKQAELAQLTGDE